MSRISIFLFLALIVFVSADSYVDEIKRMQPFEIRSSHTCPAEIIGSVCPEASPLFYYKCCGDLNRSCCFRLQDWVIVLLAVLSVFFVFSMVTNIVCCLRAVIPR